MMYVMTLYSDEIVIVMSILDGCLPFENSKEIASRVSICHLRLYNALEYLHKLGYYKKRSGEYIKYQKILDAIHALEQPSKEKAIKDCMEVLSRRFVVDCNNNLTYVKPAKDD